MGTAHDPLPIFRSSAQRRLLTFLFVSGTDGPWSLSDLSDRIEIPLSTLQREVHRLDLAGIVLSQRIGNTRLVMVNLGSRFFPELQSLLVKAYGPTQLLAEQLRWIPRIERAFIFGSWARRYSGETGLPPNDVDVLVVGNPPMKEIYRVARRVEADIGLEVNPVVVSRSEFESASGGLVKRVTSGPIVELELT